MNGLDREFHRVVLGLEMVSHGTVAAVGYSTFGKSDEAVNPPGANGCEHLHWRGLWERAATDDARATVLANAQDELHRLTGHDPKVKVLQQKAEQEGETQGQFLERIVEEGEGWDAREAAVHFRCLERTVRRTRREHGRDPDRGYETAETKARKQLDPDHVGRARDLKDKGVSERNIALILDLHKTQVRRALGKAA